MARTTNERLVVAVIVVIVVATAMVAAMMGKRSVETDEQRGEQHQKHLTKCCLIV